MSERLRESLSALMDDEADDLELGRILRAMEQQNSDLGATWSRYQLVSAVLQRRVGGQGLQPLALTLEDEDDSALADASADDAAKVAGDAAAPERRRWRGLTSFAVAASLTAVAVVGWQWQAPNPVDAPRALPEAQVAAPVRAPDRRALIPATQQPPRLLARDPENASARERAASVSSPEDKLRKQVEAFMVRHAEHNALHSRSGMMPFARMAAFDGTE